MPAWSASTQEAPWPDALDALTEPGASSDGTPIDWPEITLLDGRARAPESWAGRPALVVFWATWCPYCRRHNPRIEQLFRAVDPARLQVLGVALDQDARAVRDHVRRQGLTFPVTLDDGGLRRRFTERRVLPMTCLVDTRGRIRLRIPGEMSADDVRALGAQAIAG
ncbi:TlpA disulfide reductase family protein [Leptospira sp. 96542]|nr:TlpA disulfide reductase family protein [Leptospira sp. 96542]